MKHANHDDYSPSSPILTMKFQRIPARASGAS